MRPPELSFPSTYEACGVHLLNVMNPSCLVVRRCISDHDDYSFILDRCYRYLAQADITFDAVDKLGDWNPCYFHDRCFSLRFLKGVRFSVGLCSSLTICPGRKSRGRVSLSLSLLLYALTKYLTPFAQTMDSASQESATLISQSESTTSSVSDLHVPQFAEMLIDTV